MSHQPAEYFGGAMPGVVIGSGRTVPALPPVTWSS